MVGVVVHNDNLNVAKEFFELFKISWEPAVAGRTYHCIICMDEEVKYVNAKVVIVYGRKKLSIDDEAGIAIDETIGPLEIEYGDEVLPLYKGAVLFGPTTDVSALRAQGRVLEYRHSLKRSVFWRVGYDLLGEVRFLLSCGQPVEKALTPTLELHIALLRHRLVESGVPFLEIPPRPVDRQFICCLSHDVDFFGIRRHMTDRTLVGFLYRASIGTVIDLVKGRRSIDEAFRNWMAIWCLPFIFARMMPDFWRPFEDYAKVEDRKLSTFFLVPFKGRPGVAPDGSTYAWRATPYGLDDVRDEVKRAVMSGSEIGLHGIDAWHDRETGLVEMRQVTSLTGQKTAGVRMHWLYFDVDSPKRLEEVGFDYDSTCGYNETVGYRAGTSQVFRPLGCTRLLEVPMTVMDSALFSWGRLRLTQEQAGQLCDRIVANARRFGGTVVINWHDRSLAPERLWGRFYQSLLQMIRSSNKVWFARMGDAVEWFRWRRSIRFINNPVRSFEVTVVASRSNSEGAVVQVYNAGSHSAQKKTELPFHGSSELNVSF